MYHDLKMLYLDLHLTHYPTHISQMQKQWQANWDVLRFSFKAMIKNSFLLSNF